MKARVLIIENEADSLNIMAKHLNDCGYQVLAVGSSSEGLALIEQQSIDLVLCDLSLSEVISTRSYLNETTDVSFLQTLKERLPRAPFIVVSDTKSITRMAKALRAGADDFLVKPFVDLVILEHTVQHSLEQVSLEIQNIEYRNHLESMNSELRARLEELHSDQLAGRHVQLKMLPEPFCDERLQITHTIKPSLILSGDCLDYFALDDTYYGFYLADVAGHGASSAFVTVLLKNLTYRLKRNLKRGSSSDLFHPVSVLERMNEELLETGCSKHLTIVYGVLNLKTLQLDYSIGGHLPMPILYSEGQAQYLVGKGMPVGLFKDAKYNAYQITLTKKFTLSMFSDGVLELLTQDSLALKEQYLLDLIQREKGNHASIIQALSLDVDSSIPDDVALLTLVGV